MVVQYIQGRFGVIRCCHLKTESRFECQRYLSLQQWPLAKYLIPGCVGRGISIWDGSTWQLLCVVESRIEKQGVQKLRFKKKTCFKIARHHHQLEMGPHGIYPAFLPRVLKH